MKSKFYSYAKCSTCQKALKHLQKKGIEFTVIPIVDQPPTVAELRKMLGYLKEKGCSFKNLFNISGVLYREMKISDKIKNGMTESEAIKLLSHHGKLIKRPFFLTANSGSVGFKED